MRRRRPLCSSASVSNPLSPHGLTRAAKLTTWIDVLDSLAGLMVVDELEEDGSGMYYSDDSSVASSNTAG